jgi:cell division protein ZapA (FtsZ GTPase activity inhibitor)
MKRELAVRVAGQTLTLRTDEPESYVNGLAAFVDARVHDLSRGQPGASTLSIALMAALTIADEVHKRRVSDQAAQAALETLSQRIEVALRQEA